MKLNQVSAAELAVKDLAERLSVAQEDIETASIEEAEYPDMSFGAPIEDEMAAQMIANGWRITLASGGKNYEYRADKYQLRLFDYNGANYVVAT